MRPRSGTDQARVYDYLDRRNFAVGMCDDRARRFKRNARRRRDVPATGEGQILEFFGKGWGLLILGLLWRAGRMLGKLLAGRLRTSPWFV